MMMMAGRCFAPDIYDPDPTLTLPYPYPNGLGILVSSCIRAVLSIAYSIPTVLHTTYMMHQSPNPVFHSNGNTLFPPLLGIFTVRDRVQLTVCS